MGNGTDCLMDGGATTAQDDRHTPEFLKELQAMPWERKVMLTQARIMEFYRKMDGKAYVSFSGGKDSTVLLNIARQCYPDIPAVFSNTGLEYPEIRRFAKAHDNVEVVQPKMRFDIVISTYGYPLISKEVSQDIYYARRTLKTKTTAWGRNGLTGCRKQYSKKKWLPLCRDVPVMISHYCCQKIKKDPLDVYKRKTHRYPITAMMAEESKRRKTSWLRTGCNAFEGKIQSKPMSFWTEQDVLWYIVKNDLDYCSVYGDIVAVGEDGNEYDPHTPLTDGCKLKCTGCKRTGCIYCGFGAHLEKGVTRFQRLAWTHPRQYDYCMNGGQWVDNPAYDPAAPEYDGEWKNWNPKKIFVPSKKGLGLKTLFDMVNEIYGKDFYRYD